MMMPMLSARYEDGDDAFDEATGRYLGSVILEFGGHRVARWRAPIPFDQTNEEYAAEFAAARLAELFAEKT